MNWNSAAVAIIALATACAPSTPPAPAAAYTLRTRDDTLEGKEVYAFSPSTISVMESDTL